MTTIVGDKVFKVRFVGDAITPVYRVRMYQKRKFFNKFLHEERFHRDNIESFDKIFTITLQSYIRILNF